MDLAEIVRPYTMASPERVNLLNRIAADVNKKGIPGDMVECGTCNGGLGAVLAHHAAKAGRKTWLFDSFEGMPEVTEEDDGASPDGNTAASCIGKCVGDIETVRKVVALAGGDLNRVEIVKGRFQDTFPTVSIPKIALLILDSDWYESERLCLEKFFGRVQRGGFVYFDDYYYWPGCRTAIQDFFLSKDRGFFLSNICRVGHSAWIEV